jgi:hypothetical protein
MAIGVELAAHRAVGLRHVLLGGVDQVDRRRRPLDVDAGVFRGGSTAALI